MTTETKKFKGSPVHSAEFTFDHSHYPAEMVIAARKQMVENTADSGRPLEDVLAEMTDTGHYIDAEGNRVPFTWEMLRERAAIV